MYGLTHAESPTIPLQDKLRLGSLPGVLLSEDPWEDLKAYTDTYLKEEIEEEEKKTLTLKFRNSLAYTSINRSSYRSGTSATVTISM